MKKITLLIVLFSFFSCSNINDEFTDSKDENVPNNSNLERLINISSKTITKGNCPPHISTGLKSSGNCIVPVSTGFSSDLNTYGNAIDCNTLYPSGIKTECFPYRLNILLSNSLNNPNYQIGVNQSLTILNTNYSTIIDVRFIELGLPNSIYLYPDIEPIYSNLVFTGLFCEIKDYLNSLPTLPSSNQFYFPDITFLGTDFVSCEGPYSQHSYLTLSYDVKILVE